ncbi:hypothetical protein ACIQ7Q_29640 [Streptomyces sp. NPDC096176]|uniref:hypothetical protein n=1 Tax=Streptomyces sp. NPDC096176 TaxID=3366079 RepID=UPI0037F4665A
MATGVAAAGLLTGCSNDEPASRREPGRPADSARAEAALRRRLAATSAALRDEYDAVIARHPALADRLTPLRTAVAEHAVALAGLAASAAPSPSVSATASPTASSTSGPATPPAEPGAALKSLVAAERRTADRHTAALADAEPELARLLASVAAAGAAHAYLLAKGDA